MKKRKILFLLLSIIAIVGCSKKEVEEPSDNTYSFRYNDDYYTIYMPYKKGVGNNYVVSSNVVDYDINKVEKDLIQISSNVFPVDENYYQEGQYLSETRLRTLLNRDNLNNIADMTISGKKIKPTVVVGIYEKNFLDNEGKIKGISLGLILNPYQGYGSSGNYVTINQNKVIDIGKAKAGELVKYLRENFSLDNIPIMVALYVEASPESNTSGNYLYYGVTSNNDLTFEYLDQKNYYMNNESVKKLDSKNYNSFKNFTNKMYSYDKTMYVSGLGYYSGNHLSKLDITITKSYYSYGELLYISQFLSENMANYFKDIKVVTEVKAINEVKAYIVKEEGETSTDIFIY